MNHGIQIKVRLERFHEALFESLLTEVNFSEYKSIVGVIYSPKSIVEEALNLLQLLCFCVPSTRYVY